MSLLQLLKEQALTPGPVRLASGKLSDFYLDVKRVSLTAQGSVLIGQELFEALQREFPDARAAGGLSIGADPLATAVSYTSWLQNKPLNAFLIRKEAKEHGRQQMVEGAELTPPGSPVVILEDVVTSGGSSLEAVKKAKAVGWEVLGVLAVVDRDEGGRETLSQNEIRLSSLFRRSDFGIV